MLRQPYFWIVLVLVIVLLFGANKLPGLAGSVGKSLKIFKKEVSELSSDKDGESAADAGSEHASIDYSDAPVTPPARHSETSAPSTSEPPK